MMNNIYQFGISRIVMYRVRLLEARKARVSSFSTLRAVGVVEVVEVEVVALVEVPMLGIEPELWDDVFVDVVVEGVVLVLVLIGLLARRPRMVRRSVVLSSVSGVVVVRVAELVVTVDVWVDEALLVATILSRLLMTAT